jgi:hypothetical protein
MLFFRFGLGTVSLGQAYISYYIIHLGLYIIFFPVNNILIHIHTVLYGHGFYVYIYIIKIIAKIILNI